MSDTDMQTDDTEPDDVSSRRHLLGKGAVAAAAVAVAGLASSQRAHAATGDTMFVGQNNAGAANASTRLTGGSTFWVQNGRSDGNASLYGTSNVTAAYGVRGASGGGSGTGVFGESSGTAGTGVYGIHQGETAGGIGVHGWSKNGPGVVARGTTFDLQANGNGRVGLTQAGTTGATANGSPGTIARDAAGNLWYCYATNKWQRVGGPGVAGAFHPISPVRVYDSRIAAVPGSGPFTADTNRVISVKDARNIETGAVTTANVVPAGATGVAYNLTVAGTVAAGFLFIAPGNAATLTASSINWSAPGSLLANAGIVPVDASRQVKIFCGGPGAATHAIIDVSGYYL